MKVKVPTSTGALRLGALLACALLAFSGSPALAKKKGKKKGLGPVVTRTATSASTLTFGETVSATAVCPKGRDAIGGGFAALWGAFAGLVVYESLRTGGRSWTASGFYYSTSTSSGGPVGRVDVSVYCRRFRKPIVDVAGSASIPGAALASATATAACEGKSRLVGGGFSAPPVGTGFSLPHASFGSGKTWTASVHNGSSAAGRAVTSHAYCATGVKAPGFLSATTSQEQSGVSSLSLAAPACSGARRQSGGGFLSPPRMTGGPFPVFTQNGRSGNLWLATATNFGAGAAGTQVLTTQGICL